MPKSPNAFRTISEAAAEVGVPQHVLRFWETKFTFVQPVKRAGGRRFYRPQDIAVLQTVRRRLHDEGLTIKGVQRLHRTGGLKRLLGDDTVMDADMDDLAFGDGPVPAASGSEMEAVPVQRLQRVLARLEEARARLDAVLSR